MINPNTEIILNILTANFQNEMITYDDLPKPYPEKINNPKAILIGCDPSNNHNIRFKYVFALERTNKKFEGFLKSWDCSLCAIGLNFNKIYTQNLCRNYFKKETSKNKIWYKAAEIWIPELKKELDQFDKDVPVLMSSEYIYKSLLKNKKDFIKASAFYNCTKNIPISSKLNKLDRPLIPFYRHFKYSINKYPFYQIRVIEILKQKNKLL